ncbi:MAG: ABC transporter substrate-binding protein [Cyanobacteriota bacterium]
METSNVDHFLESIQDLINVAKYAPSRAHFLIQASILISRTTGFVSALKAGAAFNDERIEALITDWQAINASAWLAWPTKESHRLKQQTQLIATDLARLNDTPKTEELQHLSRLLEAANRKIEIMLNPKKNLNAMLSVSLQETKSALSLQSIDPNHLENRESELIDMWHLCHRSSKFTDPSISLICKRIFSQLKGISKPNVQTSGNRGEELLNSIEEIHKVLEMIEGKVRSNKQKNRRSICIKLLPIVLLPSGVIAGGAIIMGMKDFSDKPIQAAGSSSHGENLLIKSDEIRGEAGEACLAHGDLKANAINSFNNYQSEAAKEQSKELVQAIAMMQQYVISCPQDAEAQIYLNNYVAMQWGLQNNAAAAAKPMQFVKLAVVVPISRKNGVKDSLEILRGVSRAQYFINKEGHGHRVPTFIIQIFDDGTTKLEAKDRRQYACGVAQSIVQSEKNSDILAIIGHFSSDNTEATSGIYHLYNLPVISPTSTNVRAPIQDFNQRFSRPPFINSILNFTTDRYARNFLSNYALLWAAGRESASTRLCRLKASKGPLILDKNIYRMPPNDSSAQENLFHYLSTYNTYVPGNQSHLKVNRIVLVWERSNTSRYSEGFRDTLKEAIGDQYDFLDQSCRLLGSARYANEQRCKDEDILNNPYGTTALVLVPNSASIQRTEELTKDVLLRVPDRKKLMVFGADSFMTADVSDPIFKGLIIASASEERMLREPAGADRGEGKQIAFRWRSQMAYDSMILLREVFRKAIQKEMDFDNTRAMRSFVLDNITAEDVKAISVVDQQPVRIDTRTHDRLIAADSESLNVLLCLEHPGSTSPFRKLKVFNSPELQEEAGEASFCMP